MNFQTRASPPLRMLLLFSIWILGLQACADGDHEQAASGEIFPLPALSAMMPLDERRTELDDKILLINFWATWCSPCREEMPDLQGLSDTVDRDNFAVIGISIDEDGNLAREFLLQSGIRFANFLDREQALSSGQLGIRTLPATFIVDVDGQILARIDGVRSWNRDTLRQLLGSRYAEIAA